MNVKERLESFIKTLNLKNRQFEEICNISNGYINNIRVSIGPEILQKILNKYPQLNKIWLLHGEGEMLSENDTLSEPETYLTKRRKLKNDKENALTYYDIGAAAGPVGDILPVNKTEGKLYISDLFRNTQFAVRISGNSMTPGYPPGAIVGIKEIQDKQISPGTVYVIEKGNELWIKRLFYKDDKQETGRFELISDNSMRFEKGARKGQLFYPAFHVGIDEVRVFKVTGIFKSNELIVI
jgi:SOS-response transcriptional repressor LexA